MKKIAFIINPISGNRKKQEIKRTLPERIMHILDSGQWSPVIVKTEYAGHATELARRYAEQGYDAVVAVGGDGTMNEVARGLRDTTTAMGIIPMGSGNGFAIHLHIPLQPYKAVEMLNHSTAVSVDYGLADERLFVSTCGTGLDAVVADRFANSGKRGFLTYVRNTVQLLFTYRPETYTIQGDGLDVTRKAFLITFANANQWGNGAKIAPIADLQDGRMDIMLMSRHALWGALPLAVRLFAGTIDRSPLMTMLRARDITLRRESAAPFHIDGEPVKMGKDIHIRIVKDGLRVMVRKN